MGREWKGTGALSPPLRAGIPIAAACITPDKEDVKLNLDERQCVGLSVYQPTRQRVSPAVSAFFAWKKTAEMGIRSCVLSNLVYYPEKRATTVTVFVTMGSSLDVKRPLHCRRQSM